MHSNRIKQTTTEDSISYFDFPAHARPQSDNITSWYICYSSRGKKRITNIKTRTTKYFLINRAKKKL